MNIRNIILGAPLAALAVFAFPACSHDKLDDYSGPRATLYIQEINAYDFYGNPISYKEGTNIGFENVNPMYTTWTISFAVKMSGEVERFDRPYRLIVEADSTTAVENEDYDLSRNDFTIKAGCASDTVYVDIKRTEKLKLEQLRLSFHLLPNENFNIDIPSFKNSTSWSADAPMLDATRFYITFSEFYKCPNYWIDCNGNGYFGEWTPKKFAILNSIMGWTYQNWVSGAGSAGSPVAAGRFDFAAKELRKHLQKLADAGTPETEVDGTFMQLGPDYAVDYSKYE